MFNIEGIAADKGLQGQTLLSDLFIGVHPVFRSSLLKLLHACSLPSVAQSPLSSCSPVGPPPRGLVQAAGFASSQPGHW